MTDPVPSKDLVSRITAYLSGGGLFNPELANHERVRDLLIECRDALTAHEPAAEWQPIELAPKDGRSFLAVRGGAPFICRWGAGANIWQQDSGEWRDPKYWMPLPARPAQPPRDGG
jgi:hypothetical protein